MALTLEKVRKVVGGDVHLYGVDLEIATGSFNVLLGPTLAGKTSLLRLMAGLDHPSSGRIVEHGKDVTGLGVRRRDVAMVYQEFVNYPSFTVYDNIASPLRQGKRLSATEIDAKVKATAEMLHIEHLLARLPAELSGGQQQRIAMARALAKDASLLLLDEPFINLDYKLREELRREMRQMFGEGTTVVYATTEPQEALMLGGNTAVLDVGELLQHGPALEVYHRPATTRAGEIFSDPPINIVQASIDARGCRLPGDTMLPLAPHMRSLPPGDYRLGMRANHIDVTGRTEDEGVIPALVELAEINGSETHIHARHGPISLGALIEGVHQYDIGDTVNLRLDLHRMVVFNSAGELVTAPRQTEAE